MHSFYIYGAMHYNKVVQVILANLQEIISKTNINNQLPHISELSVLFIRDVGLWQPILVQFDLLIHTDNTRTGSLFITLLIIPHTQEAE